MTKGIHKMHSEAERKAVSFGPRISNINGKDKAAYFLTKEELRSLFAMNGFNPNGVAWLNMVINWKEIWEEVGPSASMIKDVDESGWRIYFIHPNKTDLTALKMFGEDKGVPILAVEA